jgi:hypothetical protein
MWWLAIVDRDPCRDWPCDRWPRSLLRSIVWSFVASSIAIEHAIVHHNSRCVRTCSFARFITIEVLVRDYHRDRQMSVEYQHTRLRKLVMIESKHSAIMVVIARALPVQRDVRRDWTEQQLVMSCCDRLTDRRGQLEHSHAASLSQHHERNSASRDEFFSWTNLKRRCERGWWLVLLTTFTDLKRGDRHVRTIIIVTWWSEGLKVYRRRWV